jgi:hypothetical protein
MNLLALFLFLVFACGPFAGSTFADSATRPRVIVSSDIGGTDFDDFQSMVHLLVYADAFDLEGLISSPYGPGRKADILKVIDAYERDYPNLESHSDKYPTLAALRAITKVGATDHPGASGVRTTTEGSNGSFNARVATIRVRCTLWNGAASPTSPRRCTTRRTFCPGCASGPNKKWSVDASH